VKVCEGVIEKYKASNYAIQKNVLEQFQREAEHFRRNRNNRHRRPTPTPPRPTFQRFSEPARDPDNTLLLDQEIRRQEEMQRKRVEA
jgi:hypothetical protein